MYCEINFSIQTARRDPFRQPYKTTPGIVQAFTEYAAQVHESAVDMIPLLIKDLVDSQEQHRPGFGGNLRAKLPPATEMEFNFLSTRGLPFSGSSFVEGVDSSTRGKLNVGICGRG